MKKILSIFILFFFCDVHAAALKITQLPVITNSQLDQADVTAVVDFSADVTKQLSIGQLDLRYSFITVSSGVHKGRWILDNATYDFGTGKFNRIDVSKTAFAINLRATDNLPYEANTTGIAFWKAQPGTNPISDTYGSVGGWENVLIMTQYSDLVVGGYGIEIDGNGIVPYGRISSNTQSSKNYFGIMTNVFNDYSAFDRSVSSSWRAAINQTDDAYSIARAAPSSTTFVNYLSIDASGTTVLGVSPASSDSSKAVATTEYVKYKRFAAAQINNTGTASIVTQVDDLLDDAIASVSRTGVGVVQVNFKSGYFSATPVVGCSPYNSANNNWLCSVNSTSVSSTTINTFNSGTTLTDLHFTIHADGKK